MTLTMPKAIFLLVALTVLPAVSSAEEKSTQSACTSTFTTPPEVASAAMVIFGELHGTNEAPALIAEFVCQTVMAGKRAGVGLEIPSSEQPLIDTYLASSGTLADRAALFRGPFWHRSFQDGRSSGAMANLIESLRRLKAASPAVQVVAMASSLPGMRPDASMAQTLKEAMDTFACDQWVVLVGNVHASKVSLIANNPKYQSLSYHLASAHPFTVNIEFGSGTAWNCQAVCGVSTFRSLNGVEPKGFQLGAALRPGFDAAFRIAIATASLPVAGQVTAD